MKKSFLEYFASLSRFRVRRGIGIPTLAGTLLETGEVAAALPMLQGAHRILVAAPRRGPRPQR
jgi:hypothetical protein